VNLSNIYACLWSINRFGCVWWVRGEIVGRFTGCGLAGGHICIGSSLPIL
jgi:hypothetical protein